MRMKPQSMKIGKLYLVGWEDAASAGGWHRPADEFESTMCETVGWVVEMDDAHVLLANSKNEAGQQGGLWYIPLGMLRTAKLLT